jgi:thiamine phosphate synthase YjbQ (UPF0047 family)
VKTHRSTSRTQTQEPPAFRDITPDVQACIDASGVETGHVTVSCPDGAALVVNEVESGLVQDIKRALDRLKSNGSNPRIGSASVVLPSEDGRLRLGTWQRILLVELERPCERTVTVQIVGE